MMMSGVQFLLVLHAAAPPDVTAMPSNDRPTRLTRLYVRLNSGDWSLLRERAATRCVAPATYASNLIRAHVINTSATPVRS